MPYLLVSLKGLKNHIDACVKQKIASHKMFVSLVIEPYSANAHQHLLERKIDELLLSSSLGG